MPGQTIGRSDAQVRAPSQIELAHKALSKKEEAAAAAAADAGITYLNAAQVRARYGGVSQMSIWRWLHDEKSGFPQPIRIGRRRFWNAADLTAFERTRARHSTSEETARRRTGAHHGRPTPPPAE